MTKNLKQIAALAASVVLSLSFLAGCGITKTNSIGTPNKETTSENTTHTGDVQNLNDLLAQIKIQEPKNVHYDRKDWTGKSKYSMQDQNGHNVYTDSIHKAALFLSRDYDKKNNVYLDPYTGEKDDNPRAANGKGSTQFDHIIPLAYVAKEVGDSWTEKQKKDYNSDIEIGVNVSSHENNVKGSKGPSKYLPKVNQDKYCYTWLTIAIKYSIPLAKKDVEVIKDVLSKPNANFSKITNYMSYDRINQN